MSKLQQIFYEDNGEVYKSLCMPLRYFSMLVGDAFGEQEYCLELYLKKKDEEEPGIVQYVIKVVEFTEEMRVLIMGTHNIHLSDYGKLRIMTLISDDYNGTTILFRDIEKNLKKWIKEITGSVPNGIVLAGESLEDCMYSNRKQCREYSMSDRTMTSILCNDKSQIGTGDITVLLQLADEEDMYEYVLAERKRKNYITD